jgi:hypothetical protein
MEFRFWREDATKATKVHATETDAVISFTSHSITNLIDEDDDDSDLDDRSGVEDDRPPYYCQSRQNIFMNPFPRRLRPRTTRTATSLCCHMLSHHDPTLGLTQKLWSLLAGTCIVTPTPGMNRSRRFGTIPGIVVEPRYSSSVSVLVWQSRRRRSDWSGPHLIVLGHPVNPTWPWY